MASGNGTVQGRQGMNGNYQKNNVVEIDLSALAKADSVVLIESKSSSKISDIREEISEIGKIGKNLAGIILVD